MGLDDTAAISDLLRHIRAGCDVDKSCTSSRVNRSNFYRWIAEGEDVHANVPPEEQTDYHRKVLQFVEALALAKAHSITGLELRLSQRAHEGNVPAILAMLKKQESGSWHGTQKLELSGPEGGPVPVTAVPAQPDMTDPDEVRAIWEARAEMGDPQAIKMLAALDD